MRLIQFTASKGWRGHEQKIIYLYEEFEAEGYVDNQWIVCPEGSEIATIAKAKGMNCICFAYKTEYSLKLARWFRDLTEEKKASVVFIHSSKAHTIAVLSSFLFRAKVPLVLCRTLIKRVDTNLFRKWKYNYKGIKKIICVSQPVADILKFAVKDHSRLTVIGSVTDINKFQKQERNGTLHEEFKIQKEENIVGNIAEFTGFKDHYTWVDTVDLLVHRYNVKAKFILVGKGSLEADIKKYVEEKGLAKHIIFTGFRRDIPKILPEFDLFLFTSNNEPTGGVLLEAYACKVPIVAADAGGISEVIVDKKTGTLAQVGNAEDFAAKAADLLANKSLQAKYIENGYRYLLDNFTKEVIGKKMYEELAKHQQQ
jgi:glycosyltransferase involved in cell wall biosynthesis